MHNYQYEGLGCLMALVPVSPNVVVHFMQDITNCLTSKDDSLRYRSAELLYVMCNSANIAAVAKQVRACLLCHVACALCSCTCAMSAAS
jgi:hypothetical protein